GAGSLLMGVHGFFLDWQFNQVSLFRSGVQPAFRRSAALTIPYTSSLPLASMALATASSVASSGRIISLCAFPDGIIGKQLASVATRQSNRTGLSTAIISLMQSSSSSGLSQRMPWQPYASASLTKSGIASV